MKTKKVYYRAGLGWHNDVEVAVYEVESETKTGVWLKLSHDDKGTLWNLPPRKWMKIGAFHPWARETEKEAIEHAYLRNRKWGEMLRRNLEEQKRRVEIWEQATGRREKPPAPKTPTLTSWDHLR